MVYDTWLIGQRIKTARKAKRYTQDYVSAKANIGEKFLSQIECGNAGLSIQTLLSLCDILEVSPNYILLPNLSRAGEDSIGDILQGLNQRQLQDVEIILKIFVKNCGKDPNQK
ncbi:MAG: helix-turn-helix transcriptional regulator [Oscillospiraceae bacterium]|nr:helix-turn-helix transcriptional regulator [Oscillospiraceae bacterium]